MDKTNFDEMCLTINEILLEKGLFLRIYERKQKFRYLFNQTEEKTNTIKTLSACIQTRFNGFNVAAPYLENQKKKDLYPIDIIYEPVRNPDEIIKCFFSKDIRFAYVGRIPQGSRENGVLNRPFECYYCQKIFAKKRTFERYIKFCSGKPGIVYNFNIQNIVTFEDNIKYQGDLPFTIYADFETTAPNYDFSSPENNTMFAVSYALVIAWHYNHTLEELTDVSYLTEEQLCLRKQITTEQFRDTAVVVSHKKNQNAINLLFNIELKFIHDILIKWFNYKIKSCKIDIPSLEKLKFERENPITEETKCVIFHFPIKINLKGLAYDNTEQSYLDFLIRKEHAFIRNIFDEKELKNCKRISTLENYHEIMSLYINLIKRVEQEIKCVDNYDMIFDNKLREFLIENAPAYEDYIPGLIEDIKSVEIKNNNSKLPKFTLQIYAYFCDMLTDFPICKFEELKTVTTKGLFTNLNRVLESKVHVHHSHVSGEILGYSHDFCNWKVRENKYEIPLIGHNFLSFDIFYMVKGFRCSFGGQEQ